MKIPKTEAEMAFEELEFQLKKFGNTLLSTWLGKFLIWCVEGLNRLLTKYAPDRLPAWAKIALYVGSVLLAVLFAIYGGR